MNVGLRMLAIAAILDRMSRLATGRALVLLIALRVLALLQARAMLAESGIRLILK